MGTPDLFEVACTISRGRVVLRPDLSVGPWTPAVQDPEGFQFAILDLQGAPQGLYLDAYEAAAAFVDPDLEPSDLEPYKQVAPATLEAWRLADREQEIGYYVDRWRSLRGYSTPAPVRTSQTRAGGDASP